ncbi:hypothetical protein BU23DRAFT_533755 [Bimuria novae-zelandiae CBS 107.79]|uniref:Uncharacterized protein n=1 Tax=Bimuria novae-zelandiae CBS 107.79 TaxID=1447943 RepID=A0A6A5VDT6_9PLEO|nr:hypothetical protein BU23DRAFT_533755 [Bimuria novae-zelandiae CBS 107.79]
MDRLHHTHMHRHTRREGGIDVREVARRTTALVEGATRTMLVPRASSTADSDDDHKPTQTPTLFIVLAVTIPIVGAAIVLFYLHRRNVKKLRAEDKDDKYKSLDFGVDSGNKKKGPEMKLNGLDVEKSHGRGLSLEPDLSSPYLLPAGLHSSRESFHSLSRSTKDSYDPYGPVSFGDDTSIRSGSRNGNGSVYTSSSNESKKMKNSLLQNAQRMSQSLPLRTSPSPERTTEKSVPEIRYPEQTATPLSPLNPRYEDPFPAPPAASANNAPVEKPVNAYVPYAPTAANPPPPPAPPVQDTKARATTTPSPPPRIQSQNALVESNTMSMLSDSSYGGGFQVTPPSPRESQVAQPAPLAPQPRRPVSIVQNNGDNALAVDDFGQNSNRLSMSLRPLPPANDDPNEDPEQRANRIRSFYKEYFDDSKPEQAGPQVYNDYQEDYNSEYLDGTVFDPHTGNFIVAQSSAPFAQPVTRRAMTPPPRAPPRFRSNTNHSAGGPHMSQSSLGSARFPPPRNMSSMSGRLPAAKKPLPPPAPLSSLPTPGKLQDDFGIFNAADFAPPVSFRDRQNGLRPDSPLGAPRPFSPVVRPHTPLASSFDDLAALPTPHMLRKSGTFTALDFAPPPKFRDPYGGGSNASDAGSIRSNRSGMSNNARMAVRNGAYRVSRIPKEMVGTQDDMAMSLRPTLDMVAKA